MTLPSPERKVQWHKGLKQLGIIFGKSDKRLYTRLSNGGGVVVTQTRWHEDDLAGRLIKEQEKGGDKFKILSFPAIAEEDCSFRKKGEALHEERYP